MRDRPETPGATETDQAVGLIAFEELFRLSPSALVLADATGRIVLANKRAGLLLGYAEGDLLGRRVEELVPDRFRQGHPTHREGFHARPEARAMGGARELFARRSDGTELPVEIGMVPIRSGAGHDLALVEIVDITDRRVAEREQQRLRDELAHVGRVSMLGALSGSLAHELNQPLAAILMNVAVAEQLLESPALDTGEMREILRDVAEDGRRATDVIRRLRALARKQPLALAKLDLTSALSEVALFVNGDAALRGCRLAIAIEPGVQAVRGDRIQIQQVVMNLILNAFDALSSRPPEERTVTLNVASEEDGTAVVSVTDRGAGLDEVELEKIFEPFYTTKGTGLGIGLAISRSIIESHGGRLWAERNPDAGATFRFTLPVAPS